MKLMRLVGVQLQGQCRALYTPAQDQRKAFPVGIPTYKTGLGNIETPHISRWHLLNRTRLTCALPVWSSRLEVITGRGMLPVARADKSMTTRVL